MVTNKKLLAKIDELTNLIKSEEFQRLKKDSDELKRIQALLPNIKFKVKSVKYFEDEETGEEIVQITYDLPVINLKIDEHGNPNKNDFFYSTNSLDMISIEDMEKISELLRTIKLNRKD